MLKASLDLHTFNCLYVLYSVVAGVLGSHYARMLCQPALGVRCAGFVHSGHFGPCVGNRRSPCTWKKHAIVAQHKHKWMWSVA